MARTTIQYHLTLNDDNDRYERFFVTFDTDTMETIGEPKDDLPDWTALSFHRCDNCTLDPSQHEHCPAAVNMVDIVERLDGVQTFHKVTVQVVTEERIYAQRTEAQIAISSLLGLLLATSGCPHTAFFKPLARFHLPFSTIEETLHRATSSYLLGQFFRKQEGFTSELAFDSLIEIYRQQEIVNSCMVDRLRSARLLNGSVNALILLDLFTKTMPDAIESSLEELRHLYQSYLPEQDADLYFEGSVPAADHHKIQ